MALKRYRIWFENPKYPYEVGVGNNSREALEYAKKQKRIGNKKVKAVTLASH